MGHICITIIMHHERCASMPPCQLYSPSQTVTNLFHPKCYSFCSVSSLQSSMSPAHSLCGLPLLFFPSITRNIIVLIKFRVMHLLCNRWFSSKYRTLAVPVSVTQNIEPFTRYYYNFHTGQRAKIWQPYSFSALLLFA